LRFGISTKHPRTKQPKIIGQPEGYIEASVLSLAGIHVRLPICLADFFTANACEIH
jgi:hypothetical protein